MPVDSRLEEAQQPYDEVDEVSEHDGNRQLEQLHRIILPPEKQDLYEDEGAVHGDGDGAHSQRSKQADGIRQAGDGRGAQIRLDGTGYT